MSSALFRNGLSSSACLAVLLAAGGCDRGEKAETAKREAAKDEPAADGPQAKDDRAQAKGGKADPGDAAPGSKAKLQAAREALRKRHAEKPEEGKARGKSLMASVNEGRALVKDGRIEEGIDKYEEALAIDPNYRPALGELGWAEFNAEHYDEAHAHSLRALDLAETDKQRGMYLYNLGRIAEAREDTSEAIARYQVSLDKRPNKVVQARLDALLAEHDGPVLDATTARGLGVLATVASEKELCKAAAQHGYCGGDEECTIDSRPSGDPETFGVLFAGDPIFGCYHPVLETKKGLALMEAVTFAQYGSEIVQGVEKLDSALETTDAGTFWVLRIEDVAEGHGWSEDVDPDTIYFEAKKIVVCQLAPSGPACTDPITVEYEGSSIDGDDTQRYSATVSVDGGGVVVDGVSSSGVSFDEPGADVSGDGSLFLAEGRYAFDRLASRPMPVD